MNITIANQQINTEDNNTASINIKDNVRNNTAISITGIYSAAKSQSAAYVTHGIKDKNKIDSNTYSSLIKEADDIKEQLKISADTAKDSLKALFIRLSGVDAVKMDEDGFDLTDATPQQCVNIVEKIKIELAMHSDENVYDVGNISKDKIEQVAGSAGVANKIAARLKSAGMPVTDDNISSIEGVLDKTSRISSLSYEDKKNIINGNQMPTADNVYKIQHISGYQHENVDNKVQTSYSGGKTDDFSQLRTQIEGIISEAGLEVNDSTLNMAEHFLNDNIPMTSDNFKLMNELDNLELPDLTDDGELNGYIDRIIDNMLSGGEAGSVSLISSDTITGQVAEALDVLNNTQPVHISKVLEDKDVLCIGNLKQAITDINEALDTYSNDYNTGVMNNNTQGTDAQSENVDSYYNQIQELRMLMTAQAGAFLVKQGVNLNTTPVSELNRQLYSYDRQIFDEQLADIENVDKFGVNGKESDLQSGIFTDSVSVLSQQSSQQYAITQLYQESLQIRRAIFDISTAPDALIGAVLKEQSDNEAVTVSDFAAMGNNLKKRFRQAGQTYEAVGTQVRKDLGDSVKKAVKASTDDILKELGLEDTTANKDAVRILALNSMDMTNENVDNVKTVYQTLKSLISNMTPKTVLNMIKDNINPLKDDINDVNEYLLAKNKADGINEAKAEKYSKFLYKLEKTDGISQQDREKFIGIYKMLNIFTKDAGAAVGALIKQDARVTMGNLYTAYKSRKSYGMEAAVDDVTGISNIQDNYYNNLFEQTQSKITPLTLRDVNNDKDIYTRSVENFCEAVSESYDFDKEAQYYADIYDDYIDGLRYDEQVTENIINQLERAGETVTIGNIQTAFNVSQADYYNGLRLKLNNSGKQYKTPDSEDKSLTQIFAGIEDNFTDDKSVNTEYGKLASYINTKFKEALEGDNITSADEIEALRNANKEIGYIYRLSLRHDYKIPVVMGEDIRTVNLTLIQDDDDKGRISVEFEDEQAGHVSVEAKISKDTADIYVLTDNTESSIAEERMNLLSEALQDEFGIDKVNINYGKADNIKRTTYDDAKDSVATDRLYKISKVIIMKMSGK